jgi:hypothetical protein
MYIKSFILSNTLFVPNGIDLEDFKFTWIFYKFTVNETEYTVEFFHDSSEKTCIRFKPTESVNFDTTNDQNINAHEVFSKLMLAIEHYKNSTGVIDYKYQTNSQQKHNIFQLITNKVNITAINTEEITE